MSYIHLCQFVPLMTIGAKVTSAFKSMWLGVNSSMLNYLVGSLEFNFYGGKTSPVFSTLRN